MNSLNYIKCLCPLALNNGIKKTLIFLIIILLIHFLLMTLQAVWYMSIYIFEIQGD